MSSRKRRKLNPSGENLLQPNDDSGIPEEDEKTNLRRFRMILVKGLKSPSWSSANSIYRMSEREYKDVIDELLRNRERRPSRRAFVTIWIGGKRHDVHPLRRVLTRETAANLRRIFMLYTKKHVCRLTKSVLVTMLAERFHGGPFTFASRAEEEEFLASDVSSALEHRNQFLELFNGDILLPPDVFSHILSFVKHDYDLITSLGLCNMQCFMSVLTTWKRVVVTPRTLYSISLVVLRSATELEFKRDSDVGETFLLTHWRYLFDKMEAPRRLEALIMNTIDHHDWETLDKAIFGRKKIQFDRLRRIEVPSNHCHERKVAGGPPIVHADPSLFPIAAPALEEVIRWPILRLLSAPSAGESVTRVENLRVYDRGLLSTDWKEDSIVSLIENQPLQVLRLESFVVGRQRKRRNLVLLKAIESCHLTLQELQIGFNHPFRRNKFYWETKMNWNERWDMGCWSEFCDSISRLSNLQRVELILPFEKLFEDELLSTALLSLSSLRFIHLVLLMKQTADTDSSQNDISEASMDQFCRSMSSLLSSTRTTRIKFSNFFDQRVPKLPSGSWTSGIDWRSSREWIEARGCVVVKSPDLSGPTGGVLDRLYQGFRDVAAPTVEDDRLREDHL